MEILRFLGFLVIFGFSMAGLSALIEGLNPRQGKEAFYVVGGLFLYLLIGHLTGTFRDKKPPE
jgi:hypothetical protein